MVSTMPTTLLYPHEAQRWSSSVSFLLRFLDENSFYRQYTHRLGGQCYSPFGKVSGFVSTTTTTTADSRGKGLPVEVGDDMRMALTVRYY